MGKYSYGDKSQKIAEGVDKYLWMTACLAISMSDDLDWGVGPDGGKRTAQRQNEIFKTGASKCDGYKDVSYHQSGLALDLVPYIDGKFTWNSEAAFIKIATLMFKAFKQLKDKGDIPKSTFLHWGGFWKAVDKNKNGKMDLTESGWDKPHFEIRSFEQEYLFKLF